MARNKKSRQLASRLVMMPHHAVGFDYICGGVLLSQIDLAGALTARRACASQLISRVVTRAMGKIEFKKPVLVNDVITCYGTVTKMGTTSIHVHVDVEAERGNEVIPVTEADLVFVALGADGKPTPVKCGQAAPAAKGKKKRGPRKPTISGERVLGIKNIMRPLHINGMGNIFGGVLLDHMDLAGMYVAQRACNSEVIERCATRFMDQVEFKQPVHVNDVISCYGTVTKIGDTSVTVHVEVEAERGNQTIPVTAADIVYVAINDKGEKVSVGCAKKACRNRRRRTRKGDGDLHGCWH